MKFGTQSNLKQELWLLNQYNIYKYLTILNTKLRLYEFEKNHIIKIVMRKERSSHCATTASMGKILSIQNVLKYSCIFLIF